MINTKGRTFTTLSDATKVKVSDFYIQEPNYYAREIPAIKILAQTILSLARKHRTFTADDVWNQLEKTGKSHLAYYGRRFIAVNDSSCEIEPRVLGTLMVTASKLGVISSTGTYVRSSRKICNSRPVTVWASNITKVKGVK
jgi:hypothetical protein